MRRLAMRPGSYCSGCSIGRPRSAPPWRIGRPPRKGRFICRDRHPNQGELPTACPHARRMHVCTRMHAQAPAHRVHVAACGRPGSALFVNRRVSGRLMRLEFAGESTEACEYRPGKEGKRPFGANFRGAGSVVLNGPPRRREWSGSGSSGESRIKTQPLNYKSLASIYWKSKKFRNFAAEAVDTSGGLANIILRRGRRSPEVRWRYRLGAPRSPLIFGNLVGALQRFV